MKKLYLLEARETHQMFRDPAFLAGVPVEHTDDIEEADIIASVRVRDFKPEVMSRGRLNVVWTHEPSFDQSTHFCMRDPADLGDVFVFNVYNRNVFLDNFYSFPDRRNQPLNMIRSESDLNQPFSKKTIVTLMTAKQGTWHAFGQDVSLVHWRTALALGIHNQGKIDIYGRDWPEGIALGESRFANRQNLKAEILANYNFNFCPENTVWDYYVTEKFWEALTGNCMPIYRANRTLPMIVPPELFINLSANSTPDDVIAAVENMSFTEFAERMNEMKALILRLRHYGYARMSREMRREAFLCFMRSHA